MKRYALAALALLLCCALSGCMGLQVLWKGLDGMSQPTPETTQEVKDEPEGDHSGCVRCAGGNACAGRQ